MKRRSALKGMILFTLGGGYLYSCVDKYAAVKSLDLHNLVLSSDELEVIDILSRLAVPMHTVPELENHTALPFIVNQVDKVFKKIDLDQFVLGYQSFNDELMKWKGRFLKEWSEEEKNSLIEGLNANEKQTPPTIQFLFDKTKSLTVDYLTHTEFFMRKINYYEMAPGRFSGHMLLSELQNKNEI